MTSIQTLIATMDQSDIDFLKKMNIETDVVIGNQNGTETINFHTFNGHRVKEICTDTKGLSRNRNITLANADADICVLADDDIEYISGYSKRIIKAFQRIKEADVIIFNLREKPIKRYVIKKAYRVRGLGILHYGSVRIAFRRRSILGKVKFDERFGAGGEIPIGEDNIFLSDCLKAGLKIYAVPSYILTLPPSQSTWFNGYNDDYFIIKGKMYQRIFGVGAYLISIQDAIRHKREYASCGSIAHNLKMMMYGISQFKKENN